MAGVFIWGVISSNYSAASGSKSQSLHRASIHLSCQGQVHIAFPISMAALLLLPRELRDQIWAYACHREDVWCSEGFTLSRQPMRTSANISKIRSLHSYLQVCRQFRNEVTPFLYQAVCINVCHPNEVIRWLGTIGARASACIRHLVVRFSSLMLKFNEERFVEDRSLAWSAALRALPRLLSLTFDFEQDPNVNIIWATLDDNMLVHDPHVGNELAISATAWAKRLQPSLNKDAEAWEYHPNLRQRPVTHAVMAMNEAIPPLLLQYFSKLMELSSTTSLEQNVTGLPVSFFEESGFYLARTYSFNEDSQNPSIAMSFGRNRQLQFKSPMSSLRVMLDQLPHLLYLRVGCRNIDSSFLAFVPASILTLDVAFTDKRPERIIKNLQAMRERCRSLFTLAIAVSPLHDRGLLDRSEERFFNRQSLSPKVMETWVPFWGALEAMKASGMRVWEGEGPGFKRTSIDEEP